MEAVAALRAADDGFYWSQKISIQDIEGQGNSVLSTEPLHAGEVVIRVPSSMLVNVDTLESRDGLETHELLALELIRRRSDADPWVAAIPQDFTFLPAGWPAQQREQLPARYRRTVTAQLAAIKAFAEKCGLCESDATWAWLAVNSRCLYWARGGMTLAPAIDFLNHTADQSLGLSVSTTPHGMTVTTTRSYVAHEELTFCYGPRENGFLLVEYGFLLAHNPWEFIDITAYIEPLVRGCSAFLENEGYYGDWTLDCTGEPSFRIEVALAAVQSPSRGPVKALINGFDDGDRFRSRTAELMRPIVAAALRDAQAASFTASNAQLQALYKQYVQIMTQKC